VRNSDKEWEAFGRRDPHYGVLSHERFRKDKLDAEAVEEFFRSGREHIDFVLATIRASVVPGFAPARALDFGCGIGRCSIPLAHVCRSVVGIDVSEAMLEEARKAAAARSISNLDLMKSDDALTGVPTGFDFIHSFLVFQHIVPARGERIVSRLVELLADGGVACLQFVYLREERAAVKALGRLRRTIPLVHNLANLVYGKPFREPLMEKNVYDLNRLLAIVQGLGCGNVHARCYGRGKLRNVFLFFQKTPDKVPYEDYAYY